NNVFDAVDHAGRLATLAECHRVLRPHGTLMFTGHNLDWREAGRPPMLSRSRNPVTQVMLTGQWLRRRRHHRRLKPLHSREGDHAAYGDSGHDFSLLHYYIGPGAQRHQLDDAGFDVIDVLDEQGAPVAGAADTAQSPHLLYVAVRRVAA